MRYRPIARQFFLIFVVVCLALGWCGAQNPANLLFKASEYRATIEWVAGGQVQTHAIQAADAAGMAHAIEAKETQLASRGAEIVHVRRSSATQAEAFAASGGTVQRAVVTAGTLDALENAISAKKIELGQAAPFYRITREQPFVVTVTMFSQILTAYYFLFFLVILPLLGLRETPGRVPDTIAKSVGGSAPQGA